MQKRFYNIKLGEENQLQGDRIRTGKQKLQEESSHPLSTLIYRLEV